MPILERQNAKINYEVWGEGSQEWITLVNGHSRTLNDFRSMGRFFVERGYRVLAMDNRGAGKTEFTGDFTLEDSSDDIVALWDAVGCPKSHLLGISYGGTLAITTALRAPTRLRSLTLVSTACAAEWVKLEPGAEEPDLDRYFSPKFMAEHKILVHSLAREMGKAFRDPSLRDGAKSQRKAMLGFNFVPHLEKIKVPTLVIHGDADGVVDVGAATVLAQGISGAQLQLFPDTGHLLLAESPRKMYEVVFQFCAGVA